MTITIIINCIVVIIIVIIMASFMTVDNNFNIKFQ